MRSLLLALVSTLLVACTTAQAKPTNEGASTAPPEPKQPAISHLESSTPTRILFVGNSYFYYNDSLHNHVRRMTIAAGIAENDDLIFKSATIGGAALRDHAIDHLLDAQNLRVDAPFQIVIMQGGSAEPLSTTGRARFTATAAAYAAKARASGVQPMLYMTPAYVPPHQRYRPDMINDIASLYVETGNAVDALVIPVGLAFAEAYRRRPDIELHKSFDGSHPSMLGTYLAAATTFASVYSVSPVGNSYDYFGVVGTEDARFLQDVAHDTVTAFYGRDSQR
ncbi:DUF4886 domain-containing protein [Altererythrobacter ishigakiensis]|uniref:Lysophospholipase L1-like esterase n=1 Tax=Altererythrobacter ishigakiensis TaxID=476157 RepID=A0A562UM63_9SPHN|nr:hypothetical protein [Altererythrobacter ishigakiensis]TWJ06705.1 hypothetical protein JN10_2241 [Altererythrobacter ishigakiensis]